MEHGQYDLGRRFPAGVLVDWNATSVVNDRDGAVDMDGDVDFRTESAQRLVDGVVDDFIDEMVESGRPCRTDVHRGPFADGFEAFEDVDLVGAVLVCGAAGR